RAGGPAEWTGGLHPEPRALADALRRPPRDRRLDDHAERAAVAGGRHPAAAPQPAVRTGPGIRAARVRGRRAHADSSAERRRLRAADRAAESRRVARAGLE